MAFLGLLLLAFSSMLLLPNFSTAQTYVMSFCFENYDSNTTYATNVQLLLSSISNNTIGNSSRFYTNTLGQDPNTIYGIFQCRWDLAPDDCQKCAKIATEDILIRCRNKKEITIWYDECLLRYSNKVITSVMIGDPKQYFSYANNVTNPIYFAKKLNEFMAALIDRAVSNSRNMFALGEQLMTGSPTIYGLVQCTQDLSTRDCRRCLTTSVNQIPACCDHKDGGRILKPSCILWFEVYKFFQSNGSAEIVLAAEPVISTGQMENKSSRSVIKIVVSAVTGFILLFSFTFFLYLRRHRRFEIPEVVEEMDSIESLKFNFETIDAATDNFDDGNKLGEGGFGTVYRGDLKDGREIAVKRLSRNSGQGAEEFKNEVILLAKLQHRNLVRLLGFCLEGNEKILIYEFVQNASLDQFIFDRVKRAHLDWEKRYRIIGGIARGLLYLHEDSSHRIIHRDLKASNILLDKDMNPKISDFGMARLVVVDETQDCTKRIAGTYGYMAPEYAMHGHFSVKTDVFSFGVLVLEIISGEKNNSFHREESAQDLLSYAWRQWDEGKALELLDPILRKSYSRIEVMECVQMALLCVQEEVARRPTMASVVLMLNSYSFTLPAPAPPAFLFDPVTRFDEVTADQSQSVGQERSTASGGSINIISISELGPR